MQTGSLDVRRAATPSRPATRVKRPEIQGLRALAVMLVVLFHLWPNRLTGGYLGVDVFFVISGYLITSHLVREAEANGRVRLSAFWASRARRLLPASSLVLAVSLVGVLIWVPMALWRQFAAEIAAAAAYVANWQLANNAVDYLAADNVPSPAQHYWTLSAEEQFYLVWPLLVILGIVLARRWRGREDGGHRQRLAIAAVLAVATLASLTYSLYLTGADPARAYFVTTTRAWEFGAGALLAFVPVAVRAARTRAALSWIGLVVVAAAAMHFDEATPMPGTAAIWVVVATSFVLWAGNPEVSWSPSRILSWRPAQATGDWSYSIYLWHWPLIVLLPYATEHALTTLEKVGILIATFVLAAATKTFVEDPVRQGRRFGLRRPTVTFSLAGFAILALVAGCMATSITVDRRAEAADAEAAALHDAPCFGAASRAPGNVEGCADSERLDGVMVPDPAVAGEDGKPYPCGRYYTAADFQGCPVGTPADGVPNVAIIGDSHTRAMMPAFQTMVDDGDMSAELFITDGCGWTTQPPLEKLGEKKIAACEEYKSLLDDYIADNPDRYDAIVVTSRVSAMSGSPKQRVQGLVNAWKPATDAGIPIVGISDNPLMFVGTEEEMSVGDEPKPPVCLADADDPAECGLSRADALDAHFEPYGPATAQAGGSFIDLSRYYCDKDECPAVIGGVVVYRDFHHITATYAETLSPFIRAGLVDADVLPSRSG